LRLRELSAFRTTIGAALVFILGGVTVALARFHALGTREAYFWDAGWYYRIAFDGYQFNGDYSIQQSVAFAPLHSLLSRWFFEVTGVPFWASQMIVSTLASTAGGVLLAKSLYGRVPAHLLMLGMALIAFSPFSVFLYNGYTEAIYFLAVCVLFYATLHRFSFGLASFSLIVAGLARPWGGILVVVFVAALGLRWYRDPRRFRDELDSGILALGVGCLGVIGQSMYFDWRFADPLLPLNAVKAWDDARSSLVPGFFTMDGIWVALGVLGERPFKDPFTLGAILVAGGMMLLLAGRRFLPRLLLFYTVTHFMFFYATTFWSRHGPWLISRYSLILFPCALVLPGVLSRLEGLFTGYQNTVDEPATTNAGLADEPRLPLTGIAALICCWSLFLNYAVAYYQGKWIS
jgi:hypothetical protein